MPQYFTSTPLAKPNGNIEATLHNLDIVGLHMLQYPCIMCKSFQYGHEKGEFHIKVNHTQNLQWEKSFLISSRCCHVFKDLSRNMKTIKINKTLLVLLTTAPQKIFPLKHVLSVKGVGCSLWSANTPILKINFWNCSSHWLLATSTINSNQHLHQLQDTPHYDNPPPINLQSKTTNPWIWKILLKNHSSVIIKVSFLF